MKIYDICKFYRRKILGKTLDEVAKDLHYTKQNIYSFEAGRNSNIKILLWYVDNGLSCDIVKTMLTEDYYNKEGVKCEIPNIYWYGR